MYDSKGEKMEVYALDTLTESVQAGKHVNGPAAFGVTDNAPYEIFSQIILRVAKQNGLWK
ncbi:hypothetical protein V2I71_10505 [Peribacillus frigoritolerans]|uniref:hypothetical protein n=1 Tax=Peribacillus frigoritolerans TaxID=450367 RepID=UPI002ED206C1|nr:hypothetical protein V2I71_10505 [Peribacillus frigoritolerans]